MTAALVAAAVLAVLAGWMEWARTHAPVGCDDCQGRDPWCTCHIHTTSENPRKDTT